jgi:hypothetical protein
MAIILRVWRLGCLGIRRDKNRLKRCLRETILTMLPISDGVVINNKLQNTALK